ncbi:Frag1/DRAM/Sfk1 [Dermatophagoides pteronyssinus]|uniref:Frag1/DRAM/Sfk1 n=2 Tax=Dermatophagoides pteronyssinus TaxID=6956 RepID=A0ABQ8IZG4_DERPT|nr:DNA damage-regulated autophagy modulator protein 2-like [Dermatophagoides pteronyssinus]KAH9415669.1 Frag1/DRAM/Sfk1 [Dermatophagoides pteronyssinus]
MKKEQLWILPLILALFNVLVCFVPYFIAVHTGFVDPILPYVSDTGSDTVAAKYFSSMLDICAFFAMIIGWIRYKQINFYIKNIKINAINVDSDDMASLKSKNRLLLCFYFLSACGMIGVGNIRLSESFYVHWLLGFLIFFPSIFYSSFTCYVTRILYRFDIESYPISLIIGCISQVILFTLFIVMSYFSVRNISFNTFIDLSFRLHWPTNQSDYVYHCLASACEWLMILANVILCFSLSNRFRQFKYWNQI